MTQLRSQVDVERRNSRQIRPCGVHDLLRRLRCFTVKLRIWGQKFGSLRARQIHDIVRRDLRYRRGNDRASRPRSVERLPSLAVKAHHPELLDDAIVGPAGVDRQTR